MKAVELSAVSLEEEGRHLLAGVSFSLGEGESVAIAGPSGAGKSTLLRVIAGLRVPSAGVVRLRGVVASDAGRVSLLPRSRALAMVFQDLALWPHFSVYGNLAFALDASGTSAAERDRRIDKTLERVGLAGFGKRAVLSLSGGERQRTALARALVTEPELLLLDEPLSSADALIKRTMLDLIPELLAEHGMSAIIVTHDASEARALAKRLLILEAGRVTADDTIDALNKTPPTEFVKALLG